MKQNGWTLKREGGDHSIFTKGNKKESIPRHNEIREGLARKIIKKYGLKE